MFYAIKDLQNQTTPKTLLISGEYGLASIPKQQIRITTSHLQDQFTTEEVETALKKLYYNKNPGIDELRAEHLRYGPPE